MLMFYTCIPKPEPVSVIHLFYLQSSLHISILSIKSAHLYLR